jgi:hypothetical protein
VLGYVLVQAFQAYVFRAIWPAADPGMELLQGAARLHIVRSTLMLFSMFALIFVSWVICAQRIRTRTLLAVASFLGFFMFGMFEIGLRSVELFWVQIQLPADYLKAVDPAARAAILSQVATFQSVQHALYFPLMLGPLFASLGVFFLFPGSPRIHWALKSVMAIAVLRMALRLLNNYAGIQLISMTFYDEFYFMFVLVEHLPKAYWLFKVGDERA